jgi:two-component system, OmpR family, response regulator
MRVLIVDDDPPTRDLLVRSFTRAGHLTSAASSCEEAVSASRRDRFDLVVLDVMLPDGSGVDLCHRFRADGLTIPILLLTARGQVGDRVAGLDAGADDYLAKPFAISEVLARARALGRRGPALRDNVVELGNVTMDFSGRRLVVGGQPVLVTAQELAVLEVLAGHRARPVSREHLIEAVWGNLVESSGNSLDVLVARIRRKLGASSALLRTIRGVGYALGEE